MLHRLTRTGTAAVVAAAVLVPSSLAAAPPVAPEHCVVAVVGQEPDGRFLTTEPACFGSFGAMLASIGVHTTSQSDSPGVLAREAALVATIGTHFELFNQGGASLTVFGTDCAGGYTNLPVAWRNRISSTVNGCPRIRHFDGLNMTGSAEDTTGPGGNLSPLNNRAESIQYLT